MACDLNDAPAGIPIDEQKDNTRDLPCATGVIDLKAFLGALVKIGYDGPRAPSPSKPTWGVFRPRRPWTLPPRQ